MHLNTDSKVHPARKITLEYILVQAINIHV